MTNDNSLDGAKLQIVGEGKNRLNYTTIINKRLSLPNLPPNTYTITITKDGFEDYTKTVTVGKYDHI